MHVFVLQAGKFNIVPTIIAIGSGVALLGIVSNLPIMFMSLYNLLLLKCFKLEKYHMLVPLGGDGWLPVTKQICENSVEIIFFLLGSLCMWHDTTVHDEHELVLPREEVWNHQLQVWPTVSTYIVVMGLFKSNIFQTLIINFIGISVSHCNRNDKTKAKDGKAGQRERRSRKQAAEKGAANSSKKPEEIEPTLGSSPIVECQLPVDRRGPTIPRNTGQRYSAILSPQGAEPRHHITFSSHN